ncbi:TPM domain-containing protein [Mycobacterium hodleri]|uniref:TPM domain-containing protein n=1 Tax=Mycolicibacterium hodleri TaxID=49897 RepID=A0A502EK69_9MYCO|nr:TPM domain-containing protein [Mycolicibacterium hodleri]TPG37459.1 TPM domain-containing protein [Mycolicibacterium hodleri]
MWAARVIGMLLAILTVGALLSPSLPMANAEPPLRLTAAVTDNAGVLDASGLAEVTGAIDGLYNARRVRLWVVYVDSFSGQTGTTWAQEAMRINDFQSDQDAILAVATQDRDYALLAGTAIMSNSDQANLRRNEVEPALRQGDWAGAATAAATGLKNENASGGGLSGVGTLIFLAMIALAVLALVMWGRRRRRKRREAEFAAAKRVDPADPNALAALSLDALDDLSKSIVVEVDNAVRTSDNELTLAVEEFGERDTAPFVHAVTGAKTALTQAFNVRQILDDTVPETPQQRRDLLTRVVVAAARADDELEAQREAFGKLRDLVINAPDRLDTLTQQMVDLTARIEPAAQTLAALHTQFSETALASISGNVDTAKQRLSFADQNISQGRALVAKPAGSQGGLVDAVRAAESSLGQARTLLDAVDSASTDINRAVAALPAAIADIQNGIDAAGTQLASGKVPRATELATARDAAAAAVAHAQSAGTSDPLGAFTQLTQADAQLDRLLAAISDELDTAARLNRAFDQALFGAQSQVRSVSDFIDTRRGSVGPEARTRLAEAVRQLEAAQALKTTNTSEAIQHANGAAMLAAQAQSMANADVNAAQRQYTGRYGGGGFGGGGGNTGAILGGILIGNLLSGALRGGIGGSVGGGGGWSPGSFGGSGGDWGGGGGRF